MNNRKHTNLAGYLLSGFNGQTFHATFFSYLFSIVVIGPLSVLLLRLLGEMVLPALPFFVIACILAEYALCDHFTKERDVPKSRSDKFGLREILFRHYMWLSGWPVIGRCADLHGADLHGADLHGADLLEANLRGAILIEADLRRADLSKADLSRAILRGADLRGADLLAANLRGADLLEANLHGAALHGAYLSRAKYGKQGYWKTKWPGDFDPEKHDMIEVDESGFPVQRTQQELSRV